jgi:hypothetical protein
VTSNNWASVGYPAQVGRVGSTGEEGDQSNSGVTVGYLTQLGGMKG